MFVVIGNNSGSVVAIGTGTARAYTSQDRAHKAMRRLEKLFPGVQFFVLPISEMPSR